MNRDLDVNDLKKKVLMDTNGSQKKINKEGHWKVFGKVYYLPDAMMNIVPVFDTIVKGFEVYMDLNLDNAFYITDGKDKALIAVDFEGLD